MIRIHNLRNIISLIFLGLCGCTIINIDGAKSATQLKFGILRIEPANPDSTIAMRVEGFGLVPEVRGSTLGYSHSDIVFALPGSSCQIFLLDLPEDKASNEIWQNLLRENSSVCSILGGK